MAEIEYRGTNYHGFEKQKSKIPTIQQELESAFSKIANHPINLVVAGRTDAGVHASGQVVHFDTVANRNLDAWVTGANSLLPQDIAVLKATEVNAHFHARFSAQARTYQYRIICRPAKLALEAQTAFWSYADLNVDKMQQAANYLLGEHDFSAFRATSCQAKTPVRTVFLLDIYHNEQVIISTIKANAFLHHMVRNIMGSLVLVGKGKKPVAWVNEVLRSKKRANAGPTISARGLSLVKVDYLTESSKSLEI